ncbi:MAG TPA: tetratricopeptide repeat protein, partial [Enhygromyxa sp.]|nr:tetratricopeptide repeat protein [Enhygromyxa sp.]
ALELAESSLTTHREVFGEQHVMVGQSEHTIGRALLRLGRPEQAIPHAEAALRLWAVSYGDAHSETNAARLQRARCELALGRTVEARGYLEQILDHEPSETLVLANAQLELAELLVSKDPNRAASLLEAAKSHFEKADDPTNHRRVVALEQRLEER